VMIEHILPDDDRPRISYSTDHDGVLYRNAASRRSYDSRAVPRGLRWWGRLRLAWCRWRHPGHHVMGLPTAGRKLWYPVHCHKCGCRYEWEREPGEPIPMRSAYVRKDAWMEHLENEDAKGGPTA
jgi:hypothetical protein